MTPHLTRGRDERGRTYFDVYVGQIYAIRHDGSCAAIEGDYRPVEALELYDDVVHRGAYRPSLIRRDRDLQPRCRGTDLVVQGVWRSERAVREALCTLECVGAATFRHAIHLFGPRRVERGPSGPRISAPEPLTELPIRYDRAYGGTDDAAALRRPDPVEEALRGLVDDDVFAEFSVYSYPRNHAGCGYLVDPAGMIGTELPSLEWCGEELAVDDLIAPLDAWDRRPLPAAFDWYGHAWFPRIAFFDEFPATADMRPPARELGLGIIDPDVMTRPPLERPADGFLQGAHPLLWQHRLRGDERITAGGMSADGRGTRVDLPDVRPVLSARVEGRALGERGAQLDLVLVETEAPQVTLVWRARFTTEDPVLALLPTVRAELDARWTAASN